MCLGVPGRVVSVEGTIAVVDFFGVTRAGPAGAGRSAGRAGRLHPQSRRLRHPPHSAKPISRARSTMYEQLLREADDDLMAADVRGEIEGTRASMTDAGSRAEVPRSRERARALSARAGADRRGDRPRAGAR